MYFKSRPTGPLFPVVSCHLSLHARSGHSSGTSSRKSSRARRRGVSAYMFVLAFPMMIGVLGIVIDLGNLYSKRAQAQRAADAAAIAGAMEDPVSGNIDGAAKEYARLNGYDDGINGARVRVDTNFGVNSNDVRVVVSRAEPVYFAPILEGFLLATGQANAAAQFSRIVSAAGTATRSVVLPLGLGGVYGVADPSKSPTNNSVFGPFANYNFGDAYSARFLQDGKTPNPLYEKSGGVGEYAINITSAYAGKEIELQIYDPDCYDGPNGYDEIRPPNSSIRPVPTGPRETVTQYQLLNPKGGIVATNTYGNDQSADGKWVTPAGFKFTPGSAGQYKLRVSTLSGSSENGFQLRAGPSEGANKPDAEWNDQYGDKSGSAPDAVAVPIDANDHLQINFTKNGTVKFRLGYVGDDQAGKQITVSKFDVDVGSNAKSIVYTCDSLPGLTFPGVLPVPGDGVWSKDNIKVPASYTGGNWYAEYTAGKGDSSTWTLEGQGKGTGKVRLTK